MVLFVALEGSRPCSPLALQIRSRLLIRTVGLNSPRRILNSQTLSYRATLVEEFHVVVEQASHPACVWARYSDLDLGTPGVDTLN